MAGIIACKGSECGLTMIGIGAIIAPGTAIQDFITDKIGADAFSEEDQTLLLTLAGHAAVAIENAQLYGDARAARDQMRAWNRDLEATVAERTREIERMSRELTARVLQAQEEERGRIARELHDETAQSLVKLLIDLDLLKPYIAEDGPAGAGTTRLEQGLKRTLDEVRALSHDLRPPILEDFGLAAAVRAYAEDWLQTFNVPVQVEVRPGPGVRLPMELEIALFRIAQEALMNAGKYARAREVHVILSVTHDTVELVVQDDGEGFNLEQIRNPSRQGGLGIYSMRERTALLGGSLTVDSAPGKGTRVTLRAPIAEAV